MGSDVTTETGVGSSDDGPNEQLFTIIAATSSLGLVAAFSVTGFVIFDSLPYGLIAGVMSGVGSVLFIPWFLTLATVEEDAGAELSTAEALEQVPGSPGPRLFGLGLDIGGIVMFTLGLALEEADLLLGVGGGLAVAIVVYLIGTLAVGRVTVE